MLIFWLFAPQGSCDLHHRRDGDSQNRERTNQLAPNHRHGGEQKLLSAFVGFVQDRMAVIEGIEKLRQLESVFRQIGRLRGGDALIDEESGFGGGQPELPDLVAGCSV